MNYLMQLQRFELNEDSLKLKLEKLGELNDFKVEKDWAELSAKNLDENSCVQLMEVRKLIPIRMDWKKFTFEAMKQDCLEALQKNNFGKTFFIETKFSVKIPFSKQSLMKKTSAILKKNGFEVSEKSPDTVLFLEFGKSDSGFKYRIGTLPTYFFHKVQKKSFDFLQRFSIILENPGSVIEISDFLRIAWIFKLQLIFVVSKDRKPFDFLLQKAMTMTKGIPFGELNYKILPDFPTDLKLIGFSKNAGKTETDLNVLLQNPPEKCAFVFGDEKFGLTQNAREKLNETIHLTPDNQKPLRASHALSYVLGFITQKFI